MACTFKSKSRAFSRPATMTASPTPSIFQRALSALLFNQIMWFILSRTEERPL